MIHLSTNFGGNIFIQSGDIDVFRNSIWRLQPFWILMISEFGNTDMVVVCFLICVPNLLTFGSVLDHVGTIRMVVLHLCNKFCANIFMQYGGISILQNSIWPPSAILKLLKEVVVPPTSPI